MLPCANAPARDTSLSCAHTPQVDVDAQAFRAKTLLHEAETQLKLLKNQARQWPGVHVRVRSGGPEGGGGGSPYDDENDRAGGEVRVALRPRRPCELFYLSKLAWLALPEEEREGEFAGLAHGGRHTRKTHHAYSGAAHQFKDHGPPASTNRLLTVSRPENDGTQAPKWTSHGRQF